jgi:hypothetical protein
MEVLKDFYNIQLGCENPPSEGTSICGLNNLLFIETACTFGLTFWLRE